MIDKYKTDSFMQINSEILIKSCLIEKLNSENYINYRSFNLNLFKDGVVKVQLQGSCSGCASSTMTLKQGVQNLLKHYVKEVNSVEAI